MCRDRECFDLDKLVDPVVLDVNIDFAGSRGMTVSVSDVVMNTSLPAQTAYEVMLVSSSISD